LQRRGLHAEMANPDIVSVTGPGGATARAQSPIIPRYGDVPGVPPATIRKACLAALDRAGHARGGAVRPAATARLGLVSRAEALASLHRPPETLSPAEIAALSLGKSAWHRRLVCEDLTLPGLAVALRRRVYRHDRAVPCAVPA